MGATLITMLVWVEVFVRVYLALWLLSGAGYVFWHLCGVGSALEPLSSLIPEDVGETLRQLLDPSPTFGRGQKWLKTPETTHSQGIVSE